MRLLVTLLALAPLAAAANDRHVPERPPSVVVVERQDHSGIYALAGAGIALWLTHRHHRLHHEPATCKAPDQREVERRVERACSK